MNTVKEIYEKALKEKEAILEVLKPLRIEEEAIIKRVHKVETELKVIRAKIFKIERPKLAEVSMLIARLAPNQRKLSGGK